MLNKLTFQPISAASLFYHWSWWTDKWQQPTFLNYLNDCQSESFVMSTVDVINRGVEAIDCKRCWTLLVVPLQNNLDKLTYVNMNTETKIIELSAASWTTDHCSFFRRLFGTDHFKYSRSFTPRKGSHHREAMHTREMQHGCPAWTAVSTMLSKGGSNMV